MTCDRSESYALILMDLWTVVKFVAPYFIVFSIGIMLGAGISND